MAFAPDVAISTDPNPLRADRSGIVGGAAIPLPAGHLAEASGSLAFSLVVPTACRAAIAGFRLFARPAARMAI